MMETVVMQAVLEQSIVEITSQLYIRKHKELEMLVTLT